MLKYLLLASAVTISAPVLAQSKPVSPTTAPTTQVSPAQTAPAPAAPVDTTQPQTVTPADPMATAPANPATPQDPQAATQAVPADPTAQPTQQATAEPAVTGAAQIAQVVNTEFPTYDKDKSGTLNQSEFGAWMIALKEKSDPSTKPDSPATKAWVTQAFASADKDKSKSLSKAELTGFLTQGA
jgi:hypothetical protein